MHQTTVRFGEDLWWALEIEARNLGVSVAQYVRDAALGRLSYDAGRRDELAPMQSRGGNMASGAVAAQERAHNELSASAALWEQGKLARSRAVELRERTEKTRAKLLAHPKT